MDDINVITNIDIFRKELLGFMVDQNIIKPEDYFNWKDLSIKYKALCITKAMELLEVL